MATLAGQARSQGGGTGRWEYHWHTVAGAKSGHDVHSEEARTQLQALGEAGWELVNVCVVPVFFGAQPRGCDVTYVMKRRMTP
jgi:hypothetical protein